MWNWGNFVMLTLNACLLPDKTAFPECDFEYLSLRSVTPKQVKYCFTTGPL